MISQIQVIYIEIYSNGNLHKVFNSKKLNNKDITSITTLQNLRAKTPALG